MAYVGYGINKEVIVDVFNANVTNAGTTATSAVDTKGRRGPIQVVLDFRASGTGSVTPVIQHSHTTTAGDFVTVDSSEVLNSDGTATAITAVTTSASNQKRWLKTGKLRRYIRVNFPDATFNQNVAVIFISEDDDTSQ